MKRIALFLAAVAIAVSANAQEKITTGHKTGDNWYIGINGGVNTPLAGNITNVVDGSEKKAAFSNFAPSFGFRVGKKLTTVFGLALDGNIFFRSHKAGCPWTFEGRSLYTDRTIAGFDLDLVGTFNLINAFYRYWGDPQIFELNAIGGFGWVRDIRKTVDADAFQTKVGLNFAFNIDYNKAWQIYFEPTCQWRLQSNWSHINQEASPNLKASYPSLNLRLGIVYKFGNSNDKHDFGMATVYTEEEAEQMNEEINNLRKSLAEAEGLNSDLQAKADVLQAALTECQGKPNVQNNYYIQRAANLQPSVVFAAGKSVVETSQIANIEMIAKYMRNNPKARVKITGYASPEGSKELNQRLSERRAESVKNILVNRYGIASSRLVTEGLGATDKLFDQVEFNRVALFNDTTK